MPNRTLAIIAGICALVLTIGAWWQVMIYKNPPPAIIALWLPFIVLFRNHNGIGPILVFLLQFPTLAAIFVFVSRWWKPLLVLGILIVIYALCVWAAAETMLNAGLWR